MVSLDKSHKAHLTLEESTEKSLDGSCLGSQLRVVHRCKTDSVGMLQISITSFHPEYHQYYISITSSNQNTITSVLHHPTRITLHQYCIIQPRIPLHHRTRIPLHQYYIIQPGHHYIIPSSESVAMQDQMRLS